VPTPTRLSRWIRPPRPLDEVLDDRQAQARAPRAEAGAEPRLEHPRQHLGGHPASGVGDDHVHLGVTSGGADGDRVRCAVPAGEGGVDQQVQHDLNDARPLTGDLRRLDRHDHRRGGRPRGRDVHRGVDRGGQVHLGPRGRQVTHQREHVVRREEGGVHAPTRLVDVLLAHAEGLPSELQVADHRGERVLDLVSHRGRRAGGPELRVTRPPSGRGAAGSRRGGAWSTRRSPR
jgi:hypothetical protein